MTQPWHGLGLILTLYQCSVLRPLLFTLYSAPIASIARRHGLIPHLYADDIVFDEYRMMLQYYTIKRIEACVMEIKAWMEINWLKLNDENIFLVAVTDTYSGTSLQHQRYYYW